MQKIVIEKSVAEEIKKKLASYEQVKNEEKACESGEFVKKMQNLALTEENEQKLSKLQGSKNIFIRGDFDEYKISDEELKDHASRHYFSVSELKKRGERLSKIYEKICRDTGLSMSEVVNRYRITDDDCYYDLDNPTEKFYYDLKMKFAESDKADDIEKSTKYIKRWFSNGAWHYKYPAKYRASQNRTKAKIDIAKETKLIQGIQPLENFTEKEIDEALLNLSLYAMDGKLKCPALGNHSVYITNRTQEHIKETHGQLRTDSEMKHKAKYIPFVPEILKNGKICEKSSSKQGVIYGIIGQVKYFDKKKNKSVIESLELAINYDKDLRKFVFSFADKTIKKSLFNYKDFNDHFSAGPMVDTETVPITIYSLSDLPKKSSKVFKLKYDKVGNLPSQKKKGSTEVPPNCNIQQIQKMSRKNTKELQKSLGLNDQEFESYLFSIQGNKIHKSFNVEVTDITENNKYKKVEQVEKTLRAIYNNVPFVINHIDTKGDNSEKYQNITLGITDFNKEKIEKAVHSIALALDVEPNVSNKGEPFLYKAQEDFTNNMIKEILKETKKIYLFVIDYFNLPDIRVISKANLRHKGKIVYNPETGKPITKKEWEKFLKEYEKLCQKIYGNFGEKLVMSSEVVGRMLDKITQKYPMEEVKKMSLKEMENLSKMTVTKLTVPKVFYQTFLKEQYFRNRIELAEMSVTNLITTCNENAKNKIKQILIDGIKNKDNKSKIGQQIFERCVGLNTDIQRIVDTEIQNNVNAAIIRSNVENKKENEKIYFKRSEIIDEVTCKKCKAIKGMVVLFSENPLTDEKIKDQYAEYAIWEGKTEGKVPFATMHPYCRGTWYRYYPRVVKK